MASIRHFLVRARLELATPMLLVTLRVGGAASAFAISLIMARTMAPADMGTALTYISLAPLAAILVTGSTEAGCIRFMVAYLERGESAKARGMVRFNRQVTFAIGVLLLGCLLIVQWQMSRNGQGFSVVLTVTGMTALLLGWLRIGAAHAMALGEVIRSLAPFSFFRQVLLLLGLLAWTLSGVQMEVLTVVGTMLAATGTALFLQAVLIRAPMRQIGTGYADMSEWKEWTKVGLQLSLTLLFVQFSRDLTLVVSALSLSPEDVAVLGIATAIVGFAKFFVVAVTQSVTPKLSKAIAREDTRSLMRDVSMTNHLKFWPMVLAFLVFWIFGEHVTAIFGPAFANMTPILLILMLEPLALAYFGPGGHLLSLSGHQFVLLPLSVATILLLLVAITLGARIDGLRGAAIGSSLAWVFWSASLAILSRRYMKLDITLLSPTRDATPRKSDG